MDIEATQTSIFKRRELEDRIEKALAALEPDGDICGTMLRRYCEWERVEDIPAEEIVGVFVSIDKEPGYRKSLGDALYFDTPTPRGKIALQRAALDELEARLQAENLLDKPMMWAPYISRRDRAMKECRISREPLDITSTQAPAESTAKSTRKSTARKQKKRSPAKRAAFKKPKLEEVLAYCLENNKQVDPTAFWCFYESNGWKVGKNPMKNWKSAVVTWERREGRAPGDRGGADYVGSGGNAIPVGGGHKGPDGSGDMLASRGYVPMPRKVNGGEGA